MEQISIHVPACIQSAARRAVGRVCMFRTGPLRQILRHICEVDMKEKRVTRTGVHFEARVR